ncbi:MAG: hypothetical protein WBA31_10625, partial [Candidatus Dormiibacterota bacterium]
LTESITSDWGRFRALVAMDDDRSDRLAEALALVRGPPFDACFSGRNSPYAWARDLTHRIEVAVERAGHELATLGLESGDLALADAGTSRVLRCLPFSLVAWEDSLRLASAIGGSREVGRRMREVRLVLADDAHLLEPVAHAVGWEE